MTQELTIKETEVNIVFVPEEKIVDDVVQKMAEIDHASRGRGIFDDNGASPDGEMYIVPTDEIDPHVVKQMLGDGDLLEAVGDIVEYSGSEAERRILNEKYADGWCGFSSRGEAYGWTPEA